MTNVILYCKTTKETAKALAEDMGIKSHNPYGEGDLGKPKQVIRWGVGAGIGYVPDLVLNKMAAVNKAVNKYKSISLFNENDVLTAPFSELVPCVGRTKEHTQGQNFWLCWEQDQVKSAKKESAEYFINYIPIKQEYRVHIIGGKFAFAQRKYTKNRVSSAFMGIQGFSNGWHKTIFDGTISKEIKDTAILAVKCLGLDFGGVDILISQKDGLAYVAEVNSGPSLPTPEVRKPYINYFSAKLGL